jgi:hypothetical protein
MKVQIIRDKNEYVHNLYLKHRNKVRAAIQAWLEYKKPGHFIFKYGGKSYTGLVTMYSSQPHKNDRWLTIWSYKGYYVSGVNIRLEGYR